SHSLITLSVPAAASVLPCGENARHQTSPLLFRVIRSFAVRQSHRTTVISSLADASDFPSEEKATAWTVPLCPFNLVLSAGVAKSQILMVRSVPPLARKRLSGENATQRTPAVCPLSAAISLP